MNTPFNVMLVTPVITTSPGCENWRRPQVGDIDKVIETRFHPEGKALYYMLEGYYTNAGYDARLFAILPDKSADEMAEDQRESIVNLESTVA